MAKKTSRDARGKRLSPAADRVLLLMDILADGNQRGFSSLVGCSQAVISKIANGQQEPGPRLLRLISDLPKVNPAWVKSGRGSPLIEAAIDYERGWPVPVADALLPGTPLDHSDMLSSRVEHVSGSLYRNTAYAVEGTLCRPAVHNPAEKMFGSDLIVVDANPNKWRKNLQVLHGNLCVVCVGVGNGHSVTMIRVFVKPSSDGVSARLVTPSQGTLHQQARLEKKMQAEKKQWGRHLRNFEFPSEATLSENIDPVEWDVVDVNQVVGVAIQLIRTL